MADYEQPSAVEKRVRFFDGQYLQEQDFIDEQKYHIDRQRRHNRLLHVAGVADRLLVTKTGAAQVTVSAGTAIDSDGRQLVLADAQPFDDFPSALKSKTVCLYLLYKEEPVDLQKQAGSEDNRRWLEKPDIKAVAKGDELKFKYPPVLLAELALDPQGAITGNINNQVRDYSGLRLPGPDTDAPALRTGAGGLVNLQGGLTVTGKVGIGTTSPGAMLEVANYTLDNTAFQPLIRLLAHQKAESTSNVFDESKPSYGIEFYRRWSNTITNIQAGIYAWGTGNVGSGLAFRTKPSTGSGASLPTRMVITDGGNVGIGATDPKSTLSVKGGLAVGTNYAGTKAAPDNGLLVEGNAGIGTTNPIMAIAGYQKNWKGFHSVSDTDNGLGIIEGKKLARLHLRAADNTKDKTQDFIIQNFNNSLQFSWLGGSLGDRIKALAINEDGNVGIGTTEPKSALSVKGRLAVGTNYAGTNAAPDNGLLVEGNVGIGMTGPGANLDVSGKGNTDKQISLQLRSGNQAFNYQSNQITLGYANTAQYRHAIKSRHHGGQTAGNAIDFYVWDYKEGKGDKDAIGGLHTMTLDGGNVGIGATGPEAKLDVNGDAIVSGVIKGRYKETRTLERGDRKTHVEILTNQAAAVIQGFAFGYTADNSRTAHSFAIGYFGNGEQLNRQGILDITTGAYKTFIIDHPLHQDKYLMHATLEGPEGAVYYRGTARLENGRAQIQLPDYFEALARPEGRTILLTNVDGFDALAVLTQDGAKIKDGRFIVVSSNKESNQAFDWEVKAIRKDVKALEVEPLKSSIEVERFGPYAYAVPANADRMRAPPLHAYPSTAGPRPGTGHTPGACGPRSKITNIR